MNNSQAIDVKQTLGVYTVFLSPGTFKPVKLIGGEPPPDGIPSTFESLEGLKRAYAGHELNFIGDELIQSTATTDPISDEELAYYEKLPEVQGTTPVFRGHSNRKTALETVLNESKPLDLSPFINCFSLAINNWKVAKGKKKELQKEYCNGMAKVLLLLDPSLKEQLIKLSSEDKREDDLL